MAHSKFIEAKEQDRDVDERTDELRTLAETYPDIWERFQKQYLFSMIYHENALEGIVLTHAEIESSLQGRPIAPETYGPVRSYKIALDAIRKDAFEDAGKIDMPRVRRYHSLLGSSDTNFQPTLYRPDIPLHRTYFHDIAQPNVIPGRIAKLMDFARDHDPDDETAISFAAQFHHEFMRIFPFQEHSGKMGRLLVNYILLRHGYMPVVFHATERQRYFETLRHSKREVENFLTEMMHNCIDNGKKYIERELEERAKEAERAAKRA